MASATPTCALPGIAAGRRKTNQRTQRKRLLDRLSLGLGVLACRRPTDLEELCTAASMRARASCSWTILPSPYHRSGSDAVFFTPAAATGGEGPRDATAPAATELARLYNTAVAGLRERGVKLLLHLCFGNFHGRPRTARSYRTLFPDVLAACCDQFVLEFAGREMSEAARWGELEIDRELGAGVVDVKSFYPETPEQVADRIRRLLELVPPEKLWLPREGHARGRHGLRGTG